MSDNTDNLAAQQIVTAVRAAFPQEAALADEMLVRDEYDEDAYFIWLEHFSQFTTDAIKRLEFAKAQEHLNLFSRIVAGGNPAAVRCVDVAYVESLMWDIKDNQLKKQGWKLIPANLKALYIALWGEWPFMK